MNNLQWLVLVAVAIVAYYALRRLVIANILGNLVAGTLADPMRAKVVQDLAYQRAP